MNGWVAFLLVLLLLSPLTWLRPSPRQRGVSDLRSEARKHGLSVQMSAQQWPRWLEPQPPRTCAQYLLNRPGTSDSRWCYWQLSAGCWVDQEREPCQDERLLPLLAALPSDAFKVEADRQLLALCWGERGTVQDLERIASLLRSCAQ
jgi:hypothetical protein